MPKGVDLKVAPAKGPPFFMGSLVRVTFAPDGGPATAAQKKKFKKMPDVELRISNLNEVTFINQSVVDTLQLDVDLTWSKERFPANLWKQQPGVVKRQLAVQIGEHRYLLNKVYVGYLPFPIMLGADFFYAANVCMILRFPTGMFAFQFHDESKRVITNGFGADDPLQKSQECLGLRRSGQGHTLQPTIVVPFLFNSTRCKVDDFSGYVRMHSMSCDSCKALGVVDGVVLKQCALCKEAGLAETWYCSTECQKTAWKEHRKEMHAQYSKPALSSSASSVDPSSSATIEDPAEEVN